MEWINVKDRLPEEDLSWTECIIVVEHNPISKWDFMDDTNIFVTTAFYDSEQRIWHLSQDRVINALTEREDVSEGGECVTHWMPLPEAPEEGQ